MHASLCLRQGMPTIFRAPTGTRSACITTESRFPSYCLYVMMYLAHLTFESRLAGVTFEAWWAFMTLSAENRHRKERTRDTNILMPTVCAVTAPVDTSYTFKSAQDHQASKMCWKKLHSTTMLSFSLTCFNSHTLLVSSRKTWHVLSTS